MLHTEPGSNVDTAAAVVMHCVLGTTHLLYVQYSTGSIRSSWQHTFGYAV
jgi:hypothetical protein